MDTKRVNYTQIFIHHEAKLGSKYFPPIPILTPRDSFEHSVEGWPLVHCTQAARIVSSQSAASPLFSTLP